MRPVQTYRSIITSHLKRLQLYLEVDSPKMDFSGSAKDPHSFAKPEEARVINTHLELFVDFKEKILKGKAILYIKKKPSVNEIILDKLGLYILGVTNVVDKQDLYYYHGDMQALGRPLCVQLPQAVDITNNSECCIQIEYETIPKSPALYWLTREQTADGLYPFLLSYNKLMYARTWFPCQDTPSVKCTYTAKITVPKNIRVLMSALLKGTCINIGCEGLELEEYEFQQENPVPSYAVVIAVGSLEKIQLTEEIDIFAEREFLNPFSSFRTTITDMLEAAKNLCGPYPWGRYDICVLPPSVAHFQIECPCVTFISPTLQRNGDPTTIIPLARNISQSWAGNLVTCSNYEHLWLNKSFSTFISRKIIGKIFHENIKLFLHKEELNNLNNMIRDPRIVGNLNCLLPNLTNTLPDLEIEYVPYQRGYMLLDYLEGLLGGPSVFVPFLQSYFKDFAFQSINTQDWLNYLYKKLSAKRELLDVPWRVWFHDIPSLPAIPRWAATERDLLKLAIKWAQWDNNYFTLVSEEIYGMRLNCFEKTIFIEFLYRYCDTYLTVEKLTSISSHYNFDESDAVVRFAWFLLCIKVGWDIQFQPALDFAIKYCFPDFACTIFQHVYEWEGMRRRAIRMYTENKGKMLDETQKKLEEIINLEPS